MKKPARSRPNAQRVILLKDLAPKKDPKGGKGGQAIFGEPLYHPDPPRQDATEPPNDAPKRRTGDGRPRKEGERK